MNNAKGIFFYFYFYFPIICKLGAKDIVIENEKKYFFFIEGGRGMGKRGEVRGKIGDKKPKE